MPDELEDGILYISLRFRVVMHGCCCGCKNKVITPLSPVRWKMTFDGKTISLDPSIGNWNFKCRSHYWIINSEVEWADKWTNKQILKGKSWEKKKRTEYYSQQKQELIKEPNKKEKAESLYFRLIKWIKKLNI